MERAEERQRKRQRQRKGKRTTDDEWIKSAEDSIGPRPVFYAQVIAMGWKQQTSVKGERERDHCTGGIKSNGHNGATIWPVGVVRVLVVV